METIIQETGIERKELLTISAIVEQNRHRGIASLQLILLRVFGANIKPLHYITLGYLVGYCAATDKAAENFSNQLSLCQRQN